MIFVTGGGGFIGSNLVAGLEDAGHGEIVVCDQLGTDGKWRNIAKRELADVVPPEEMFPYLNDRAREVEAIFHLGAISSTTETDADLVVSSNFRLSLALWRFSVAHGTRFIYASSAATYGDGRQGFDDDATSTALATLRPLNPYGWSKHLFDRRIIRMVERGAPRPPQWAGLKFFNVYGPNEYHKGGQRSVVHQVFERIQDGGAARLFRSHNPEYPDGGQMRDFIWVGDCVDAMLWLYRTPKVSGLYNLGTGRARSFADLATSVFGALDREPRIDYVDTPMALRDGYQYFTQARMGRFQAAGYNAPFTELEHGVARYVRDFLATDDPYR